TDTTQALALGNVVNAALAAPGQQDRYTLTLPAKALVYFDSLTNSDNLQWTLSGPAGDTVSNRAFSRSDAGSQTNPVLALPAGAYTLTVTAAGQVTGPYSFRLSDLSSAPSF